MKTLSASSSKKSKGSQPTTSFSIPNPTPPPTPRIESLHHRLAHAKDADGQPIDLLDQLMFFLDDPPAGTADRWQGGVDLCTRHGIETSRTSVWRLYRRHILQWRREQMPPIELSGDPAEILRLHEQARHLAAQRAVEMLNDPRLSPGHLIGLVQNDNHRQKNQLGRDQFNDRLSERRAQIVHKFRKSIDEEARLNQFMPAQMAFLRKLAANLIGVPPDESPNESAAAPPAVSPHST